MSLPVTTRLAGPYSCNGALVAFDFVFKVFAEADLRVVLTDSAAAETDLVITTNYTVALNADQENDPGGTITTVSTYATGYKITIVGDLAYGQPTVLTNLGGFFPKTIEYAMDRLGILIQQLKESVGRAVRVPVSSGASGDLPAPSAGKAIGWNATEDGFVNLAAPGSLAVSSFAETLLDDTTAAAARATLGVPATSAVLALAGGTMTGDITMSGASIFDANATIAAHATTCDPWSLGNYVTLTGAAVTFTTMAAAPQIGAEVEIYMNAAHTFTDNTVFEVDGNANYTAAIGDRVLLRAKSISPVVITVHPRKADGTAVSGLAFKTTQSPTSGTSVDFTGVPANARRINLIFNGVLADAGDTFLIQLGDSGGVETSGYAGAALSVTAAAVAGYTTSTSGGVLGGMLVAESLSGLITLINGYGNIWLISGTCWRDGATDAAFSVTCAKELTATLDRVRITTTTGTTVFSGGNFNISYE